MPDTKLLPGGPPVDIGLADTKITSGGSLVAVDTSDTKILAGSQPILDLYMVTADQVTILGNGTTENPLRAGGSGGSVIVEDEGVPLGNFTALDFVGAGITATNAGGGVAQIAVPGGIDVEDEGAPVTGNPHDTVNFVGAGVAVTDVAGVATVTIPGGVSGITIEEEGVPVGDFATLNFVGTGITATDAGGGVAQVAVPGGIALQDEGAPVTGNPHATVNFVGAGVTATDVAGVGTITIPGGITGIGVREEGSSLGSFTALNFVGAGVTAADAGGGVASVTVPGGITLQDEGAPVTGNPHATVNFVGAGVTATDVAGVGTITIPGGITGIGVREEGSSLGSFTALNFVGAGVTAADAGGGVASVTVPGGITLQDEGAPVTGNPHATLNFVGAGVAATDTAGVGTITIPGGGSVPGQFTVQGVISPGATGGATLDNYNPTGLANAVWIRLNVDFLTTLTGIAAQPSGTLLYITNIGVNQLTMTHEGLGSTAANRLKMPGNVTWFLPPDCTMTFVYDGVDSRWRVFGFATQSFPSISSAGTGPSLWMGNPNNNIGFGVIGGDLVSFRSGQQLTVGNAIVTIAHDLLLNGASSATQIQNNLEIAAIASPAALSADVNDWNAFGANNNVVRASQNAPGFNVTGLSGGISGMVRAIVNISAFPLTLLDQNAGSIAANRFSLPTATVIIVANDTYQVWYDATSSRWRPF